MFKQEFSSLIVFCLSLLAACSSNEQESKSQEPKVATKPQVNTPCNIVELKYEVIEQILEDSNFRQTPFTILKTEDLEIHITSFGGWDNFYKIVSKNSRSNWMRFDLDEGYNQKYEHLYVPRIYKNMESGNYYFTHYGHTEELDRFIIEELAGGEIINCFQTYPNEESFNLFVSEKYSQLFRQSKFIACSSDSAGFKVITAQDSNFSQKYLTIFQEGKDEFFETHSLQPQMKSFLDSLEQKFLNKKPKTSYTLEKTYYENEPDTCLFNINSKEILYSNDENIAGDNIFILGDTIRVRSSYYDSPGQEDEGEITTLYDFVFSEVYQELILDKVSRFDQYVVIEKTEEFSRLKPTRIEEYRTRSEYNRLTFTHFAKLYNAGITKYPLDLNKYKSE